jgi:hypothetical protein
MDSNAATLKDIARLANEATLSHSLYHLHLKNFKAKVKAASPLSELDLHIKIRLQHVECFLFQRELAFKLRLYKQTDPACATDLSFFWDEALEPAVSRDTNNVGKLVTALDNLYYHLVHHEEDKFQAATRKLDELLELILTETEGVGPDLSEYYVFL